MQICAIMMKNRMSIAYSMHAEIEAICIACAPTRLPPSHRIETSARFITKNAEQSSVAKIQLTLMALLA